MKNKSQKITEKDKQTWYTSDVRMMETGYAPTLDEIYADELGSDLLIPSNMWRNTK